MNKITIGTLTVVVTATAVTGYLTKAKVDALQSTLKTTKTEYAATRKTLDDTKQTLSKTADELVAANKSLAEEKASLDAAVAEKDNLTKQIAEKDATLKEKDMLLAAANERLKQGQGTPNVDGDSLAAKIKQLTDEHDQLTAQIDSLKQEAETQTAKAQTSEKALATATEKVRHYELNIAKMGLTGRVLEVDPGWSFVVLDVGDRNGAAVNASVILSRNGQNIGRAKIKTVEPDRSVANIIPESLPHGTTVQPGDKVVFTRL